MYKELIENSTAVACIGTTSDLDDDRIQTCAIIGYYLASLGKRINTGNAEGCDQIYALGANKINPKLVHLYLPGKTYNPEAIIPGNTVYSDNLDTPEYIDIARKYHGAYDTRLSAWARSAMNRNVAIVLNSQLVIAMPSRLKRWGGGTGHGMKVAKGHNIPVINLNNDAEKKELLSIIFASGLLPINEHNTTTRTQN